MISSNSRLFTPQDLPQVGERVAYVSGGGTRLVGYGQIIDEPALMSSGGYIARVRLDGEDHYRNVWLSSLRRVAV